MKGWKPSPQSQENFTSFPANWQRVVGVMIHSQGGWGAYVHEKRVDHHHWVGFVRLDISESSRVMAYAEGRSLLIEQI